MSLRPRFITSFRALLIGLAVCSASVASAQTTITGTVYAPNGTDPLPNILVYVASAPVLPFAAGPGVDCNSQNAVVSGNPIAEAVTDYQGNFTLASTQLTAVGSATVNIVVQAGKWRQQYPSTVIVGNAANGPLTLSMPATAGTNSDLPSIAVVTGSVDGVECVLHSMGIANSEFTVPGGSGHINLYKGTGDGGAIATAASTASESDLMLNASTLNSYDLVMFGCQGTATDPTVTDSTVGQTNLVNYANAGGRVFATHFEYTWLDRADTFVSVANWINPPNGNTVDLADANATIDTTYPDGLVLANWLYYTMKVSPSLGQIPLVTTRQDQTGVVPPTRSWATLDVTGNPVMQFTFDTPLGAPTTPIVLLAFTNTNTNGSSTTPNAFVTGDVADTVIVNVSDQVGSGPTQSGLQIAFSVPAQLTVTNIAGAGPGSGWSCNTATLSCVETAAIAAGASDPITITASVPTSATPLGDVQLTATVTGGGISGTSQCGRVLFNEYHVENISGANGKVYPSECPSTIPNAQEKFLEYSLYNLSNFIAPITTDTIDIQAPSTTAINTNGMPGVQTPIFYGQIIGDTNGLNAIVSTSAPSGPDNGNLLVYVDGAKVCTLPNTGSGGSCPNTGFEGQNAGNHSVYATFTGDIDFAPSTSKTYPAIVQPDPTTTSVATSASPAEYGAPITFTATVTDQYATAAGTVSFYDGPTLLGPGTLNATGIATYTTSALGVGTHSITAVYAGGANFVGSTSAAITQIVALPPVATRTILTSSANPAYQAQSITFTADVSQTAFTVVVPPGSTDPVPTGTVNFFDGATQIGSGTLNAAGVANFSTSALTVGTHPITAVYSGDTYNDGSTSAILQELVNPNIFTMAADPTSLTLTTGASASINVTITDVGGFNEPVQLTCAGQVGEISCGSAELTVPAGGGTTRLTVTPAAPHNCTVTTSQNTFPRRGVPIFAGAAFLLLLTRRRRRLFRSLALAAALCCMPLINGCGTSGCTDFGVLPGTYTITVTANSAAPYTETQTQKITLVVNP